jgi:glyoxalase family protein
MDRVYFKSVYLHDPDGHIVELATLGPGFFVDENNDTLGESLQLPPWLAGSRDRIEKSLQTISVDRWVSNDASIPEPVAG